MPNPPITISSHWYLIEHSASLLQSAKLILIRTEVIMQATEALQQFRLTLKLWLQNYIFWWSFSHAYSWSFPVWYTAGDTQANKPAKTVNEIGWKVNGGLEIEVRNFQTWFHLRAVSRNCHTLFICDKEYKLVGLGRRKYGHFSLGSSWHTFLLTPVQLREVIPRYLLTDTYVHIHTLSICTKSFFISSPYTLWGQTTAC